jgi:molybdopterin-guanine dinucleotide biosynthesis protein A
VAYDAIVLAGGRASRLDGVDKPQLMIGGQSLLDRVVDAVADAGHIIVVGPAQPVSRDVVLCQEEPPGGGPVAALATALPLTEADVVLVLAADLPGIAPAVPALLDALPAHGAALLVDANGRRNHLAAAWRRSELADALAAVGEPAGAAMRALANHVGVVEVADAGEWGRDCDTWDDLEQARARWEER